MPKTTRTSFHFEINDVAEFLAFVALVRSEDINSPVLQAHVTKLVASTKALTDAEKNAQK